MIKTNELNSASEISTEIIVPLTSEIGQLQSIYLPDTDWYENDTSNNLNIVFYTPYGLRCEFIDPYPLL